MPAFGQASNDRLATCDERLQRLFREVVKRHDCTILCGHRGEAEQNAAFAAGKSRAKWGESKHNIMPSIAVDVMPWYAAAPNIRWDDKAGLSYFAGIVKATAEQLGINVRWGANWDGDSEPWEHSNWEIDGPHWELTEN